MWLHQNQPKVNPKLTRARRNEYLAFRPLRFGRWSSLQWVRDWAVVPFVSSQAL